VFSLPVTFGLAAAAPGGVSLHRRCTGVDCFGFLAWLVFADGRIAT
jgi:hypothetical protein